MRSIHVSSEFNPGLPPVRADKIQLQQVAPNLLLNAFDAMTDTPLYERHDDVRIEPDASGMMKVAVCDRGTGLSVVKLDTIFQPFYSTKREGLGLGPSISTLIIEAHGARRWEENNADRGATFCFTVPVAGEKPG